MKKIMKKINEFISTSKHYRVSRLRGDNGVPCRGTVRVLPNIMVLLGLLVELLWVAPAAAETRGVDPAGTPRPRLNDRLAAVHGIGRPAGPETQPRVWPWIAAGANRAGDTDRWPLPPSTSPDWPGLGRDTVYFLGYQFVAVGVLYVAPESFSRWSEEDKRNLGIKQWKANVRDPGWDDDSWTTNYLLHPYWGAAYYIRGRERGLEPMPAFWYSALLSALFEYGGEALLEKPSYQDLIVTPVAGALIGEYLFSPLRDRIRAKPGRLTGSDKALWFVTDPLGTFNALVDRQSGLNLAWRFGLLSRAEMPRGADRPDAATPPPPADARIGIQPVWGLQLHITW